MSQILANFTYLPLFRLVEYNRFYWRRLIVFVNYRNLQL